MNRWQLLRVTKVGADAPAKRLSCSPLGAEIKCPLGGRSR